MKTTKKIIAEVTKVATEMNHPVELALNTLALCSKSIYDAIGAKGLVESSIASNNYKGSVYALKISQNTNNPINIHN